MALSAAQICEMARQIARVPGFLSQSGQLLNVVLQELCQNYDFDLAKGVYNFNFFSGVNPFAAQFSTEFGPNIVQGASGPFIMPTDFLRVAHDSGSGLSAAFYTIDGVPYNLKNIDNSEFDNLVQQAGLQSYPTFYTIIFPTLPYTTPPVMFVWPPPSGDFPATVRYYRQMIDIITPETAPDVPWFPDQNYLITRVAGELMKLANDDRKDTYLGNGATGAQGILSRYLKKKDDRDNRAQRVTLDRRTFGASFSRLKNTKTIGW